MLESCDKEDNIIIIGVLYDTLELSPTNELYEVTSYLTRDYYGGFINDWGKCGSGKIWRNCPKPATLYRS